MECSSCSLITYKLIWKMCCNCLSICFITKLSPVRCYNMQLTSGNNNFWELITTYKCSLNIKSKRIFLWKKLFLWNKYKYIVFPIASTIYTIKNLSTNRSSDNIIISQYVKVVFFLLSFVAKMLRYRNKNLLIPKVFHFANIITFAAKADKSRCNIFWNLVFPRLFVRSEVGLMFLLKLKFSVDAITLERNFLWQVQTYVFLSHGKTDRDNAQVIEYSWFL